MPMPSETHFSTDLIRQIHDSPTAAVFAVAGAGTAAISWLLGVPGASRTVLEIRVPYAASALAEFVGVEPSQFVSADTAKLMAHTAYRRAVQLRSDNSPVMGIACTATIATDRIKRGEHRCFVAAHTAAAVTIYDVTFVKGMRDRAGEDELASLLILRAIAESAGLGIDFALPLDQSEKVHTTTTQHADPIDALIASHIDCVLVQPDGGMIPDGKFSGGVLPGSFNPLHEGHEALALTASQLICADVAYELAIANVDKPPLPANEVRRRISQFRGKASVVLTREPVFVDKASLLPGCVFVIGADTAIRLIDPRYYDGSNAKMLLALDSMRRQGCRFLVAGRTDGSTFRTLADVGIPADFADMFTAIPEAAFRSDVSSTGIRQAARTGSP